MTQRKLVDATARQIAGLIDGRDDRGDIMRFMFLTAVVLALSGCADYILDEAESKVTDAPGFSLNGPKDLLDASNRLESLSLAYSDAARNTSTVQDVYSFVATTAALAAAHGVVQKISDAEAFKRGAVGLLATQAGTRGAPKSAINGMYTGSIQLNCIATVSRIAEAGGLRESRQAVAIAMGGARHVMFQTRSTLTRDPVSYETAFKSFSGLTKQSDAKVAREGEDAEVPIPLETFSKLVSECTKLKNDGTTGTGSSLPKK